MTQAGSIPEETLLREVFVVMQGSNSQLFRYDESVGSYFLDPSCQISMSSKNLTAELCQAAALCRKIDRFLVQRKTGDKFQSLINSSLCHWLSSFLDDYYKTVASLQTLVDAHADSETPQFKSSFWMIGKGLGLRRLYILLKTPLYRLRIVGAVIDKLQGKSEEQGPETGCHCGHTTSSLMRTLSL